MKVEQTAVTANPQRPTAPELTDRETARWASSLLFEGVGIGGTAGAVAVGSLTAVWALGTSLIVPGLGIVAGPIFFGLTGAGFGAIVGGMLGGLLGLSWAMLKR
jgi:uncharacterized RDD family membrane protein YckC